MTKINPGLRPQSSSCCLVNANLVVHHPMTEQRMAIVKKKLPAREQKLVWQFTLFYFISMVLVINENEAPQNI